MWSHWADDNITIYSIKKVTFSVLFGLLFLQGGLYLGSVSIPYNTGNSTLEILVLSFVAKQDAMHSVSFQHLFVGNRQTFECPKYFNWPFYFLEIWCLNVRPLSHERFWHQYLDITIKRYYDNLMIFSHKILYQLGETFEKLQCKVH